MKPPVLCLFISAWVLESPFLPERKSLKVRSTNKRDMKQRRVMQERLAASLHFGWAAELTTWANESANSWTRPDKIYIYNLIAKLLFLDIFTRNFATLLASAARAAASAVFKKSLVFSSPKFSWVMRREDHAGEVMEGPWASGLTALDQLCRLCRFAVAYASYACLLDTDDTDCVCLYFRWSPHRAHSDMFPVQVVADVSFDATGSLVATGSVDRTAKVRTWQRMEWQRDRERKASYGQLKRSNLSETFTWQKQKGTKEHRVLSCVKVNSCIPRGCRTM